MAVQHVTGSAEKDVLLEVLNAMRNLPVLWDPNDPDYSTRELRIQAWDVLVEIYRKFKPDINVDGMKKKIENMRTAFRREEKKKNLKKVRDGRNYTPSLWYYEAMSFLTGIEGRSGQDSSRRHESNDYIENSVNSMDFVEVKTEDFFLEDEDQSSESNSMAGLAHQAIYQPPNKKARIEETENIKTTDNTEKLIELANSLIPKEHNIIGQSLGIQIGKLRQDQQNIALKLISDVIFYGTLNRLNESTRIQLCSQNEDGNKT